MPENTSHSSDSFRPGYGVQISVSPALHSFHSLPMTSSVFETTLRRKNIPEKLIVITRLIVHFVCTASK